MQLAHKSTRIVRSLKNFSRAIFLVYTLVTMLVTQLTVLAQPVQAYESCDITLNPTSEGDYYILNKDHVVIQSSNVIYNSSAATAEDNGQYYIAINSDNSLPANNTHMAVTTEQLSNGKLSAIDITETLRSATRINVPPNGKQGYTVSLMRNQVGLFDTTVCFVHLDAILGTAYSCGYPAVALQKTGNNIHVSVAVSGAGLDPNSSYSVYMKGFTTVDFGAGWAFDLHKEADGNWTGGSTFILPDGKYSLVVTNAQETVKRVCSVLDLHCLVPQDHTGCMTDFTVNSQNLENIAFDDRGKNFPTPASGSGITDIPAYRLCDQIGNPTQQGNCRRCVIPNGQEGKENRPTRMWTAVGCISLGNQGKDIIQYLVRLGLGLSGGVAVLMVITAGFMFTTSQGDPKKAGEAKELMTSAVIGLFVVIFSVAILQFIGVTILHLPEFGQ